MMPAAIAAAVAIAASNPQQAFAGAFVALGALAAGFLPGERIGMALVYFTAGCLGAAAAPDAMSAIEMLASSGLAMVVLP